MQLAALALIVSQLYCGSQNIAEGSSPQTALGTAMLVYGGSSLTGYFDLGDAPLARLSRMSAWPAILAVLAFVSLVTTPAGFSMLGLGSFGLLAIDAF